MKEIRAEMMSDTGVDNGTGKDIDPRNAFLIWSGTSSQMTMTRNPLEKEEIICFQGGLYPGFLVKWPSSGTFFWVSMDLSLLSILPNKKGAYIIKTSNIKGFNGFVSGKSCTNILV
ncbi:MAG TPA: hypothetical protein VLH40_00250 [Atribacteraceae bacterium]|nr:hypothetical protein [Atribacteraceae bacterium]